MYGITVKTNSLLGNLASRRARTTGQRRHVSRPGLCAHLFRASVLGMTVLGPLAGSLSLSVPAAAQIFGSGNRLSASVSQSYPGNTISLTLNYLNGGIQSHSVSYYAGDSSTAFQTVTRTGSSSVNYTIPTSQPAGSLTFRAVDHKSNGTTQEYTTTISIRLSALSCYVGSNGHLWSHSDTLSQDSDLGILAAQISPVLYGNSLYYVDQSNKICRRIAGSNTVQALGNNSASQTPIVTSGRIYYRGTDERLWGAAVDGSNPQLLGNNKLPYKPVLYDGYIYYVGYDYTGNPQPGDGRLGQIYRTNLDGTSTTKLGNNTTYRSNVVVSGGYIYYAGYSPVGQIFRTNLDGTYTTKLGKNYTNDTPAIYGDHIYYRGNDNYLYSANLSDGSNPTRLFTANVSIMTSPSIGNGKIFFVDNRNKVWEVNLDGTGLVQIGNANGAVAPFALDPTNQPTTGQITPKYQVASVIYAAPGTAVYTTPQNYIKYGNVSTLGQTTSHILGSSSGYEVSGSVTLAGFSDKSKIASTTTNTYETTEIMTTALSLTTGYYSPAADGFDHDKDEFVLITNPAVAFSITTADKTVAYQPTTRLDSDGNPTATVTLSCTAGDLKGFLSSNSLASTALYKNFLTVQDCYTILRLDPYVSTSGTNLLPDPDKARYTLIEKNIQYCRFSDKDNYCQYSSDIANTYTLSQSASVKYETSSSVTLTAGAKADLAGVGIGSEASYTWNNSSFAATTQGSTSAVTQTASYSIFGALAVEGNGVPTYFDVYVDNIYNTYMFYPHDNFEF